MTCKAGSSMSMFKEIEEFRRRIEGVPRRLYRNCLKYLFLIDGRVCEAIGMVSPSDVSTHAYGPYGRDFRIEEYDGEEAAAFFVKTAKRGGIVRACALPLNPVYEPWTRGVVIQFANTERDEPVFNFTRQKAWAIAREAFKGLEYDIEEYIRKIEEQDVVVEHHTRSAATHAIRHVRATDLVTNYRFDGFDLSQFVGWTLRSMMGVSTTISRYAHLNWTRYFTKLLKRRLRT